MAGTLILDSQAMYRIKQLRRHAERYPLRVSTLKKMQNGELPPIGDNPRHVTRIERGFVCVLSIDATPDRGIFTRHLSVSRQVLDKVSNQFVPSFPAPIALHMLMPEFGFTHSLRDRAQAQGKLLIEPEQNLNIQAINVYELIEDLELSVKLMRRTGQSLY